MRLWGLPATIKLFTWPLRGLTLTVAVLAGLAKDQCGTKWSWHFDWQPWAVFAVIALATVVAGMIHHEPNPPGTCQQCGYNLTGNISGVCPECGRRV